MIPWTQSPYHNLPVINGVAQKYGNQFRSSGFEAEDGRITVSFANAYPEKAGINSAVREVYLTDCGMVLTDRFDGDNAPDVTEHFMTALPVRIEENLAYIGEKYVLSANIGVIDAEFVSFDGDRNLKNDWKAEGVTRISVKVKNSEKIQISVSKAK